MEEEGACGVQYAAGSERVDRGGWGVTLHCHSPSHSHTLFLSLFSSYASLLFSSPSSLPFPLPSYSGVAYAYYDPALSQKGVMLSAGRKCRPKDKNDYVPKGVVHNPHALPMFRDELWGKRKRAADRKVCHYVSVCVSMSVCDYVSM